MLLDTVEFDTLRSKVASPIRIPNKDGFIYKTTVYIGINMKSFAHTHFEWYNVLNFVLRSRRFQKSSK